MSATTVVIPCFNEARRLDASRLEELFTAEGVGVLFVDDGSTDDTATLLSGLAKDYPSVDYFSLPKNRGKAEAVRLGLERALDGDATVVGYIDADLSTPSSEALRLAKLAAANNIDAVIGARIAHMGADIRRSPWRHYTGRVFATFASLVLSEAIYDTQCGAKFFRSTEKLRHALSEPFHSRWAFDVELLGRLLAQGCIIREEPLQQWIDVPGSKLNPTDMVRSGLELGRIAAALRKWRK